MLNIPEKISICQNWVCKWVSSDVKVGAQVGIALGSGLAIDDGRSRNVGMEGPQ